MTEPTDPPSPPLTPARRAALAASAAAVLALVSLPCVTTFTTQLYFDIDPRLNPSHLGDIRVGPAGFAVMHMLSILAGGAGVLASLWTGGRPRWVTLALAACGIAAAGWQMTRDPDNLLPCGAWIAAAALGVGVAHLARHTPARRVLIAGLIALAIPLTIDAVWFMTVEHPATIQQFEQGGNTLVQSHGWAPGSPEYELYERRLRSPDAVGAFGLANILASVSAGVLVLGAGVALGLFRGDPIRRYWAILPGGLAVCAGVTLWLTHSKGAALAVPIGLAAVGGVVLARRSRGLGKLVPWLAILAVAAVVGVVLVRGAMGPPDSAAGERSLLFRSQYWAGASRVVAERPVRNMVLGVGPAGFARGYLREKPVLSPEEVSSAHNVGVDYITMLGLGGAAWMVLLLVWLWQGGRSAVAGRGMLTGADEAGEAPGGGASGGGVDRAMLGTLAGVAAVAFGTQWVAEQAAMYPATALLWLGTALGFVFVGGTLATRGWVTRWGGVVGAFAAALTLLCHNQVSMLFYQPSSAAVGWVMLGLAGAIPGAVPGMLRGAGPPRRRGIVMGATAGVTGVLLVAMGLLYAGPMIRYQGDLAAAQRALVRGDFAGTMANLQAASEVRPGDTEAMRWRVRLRVERADGWAGRGQMDRAADDLNRALALVDRAIRGGDASAGVHRLRADVLARMARLLNQPERWRGVQHELEIVRTLSPYNLRDALRRWRLDQRLGQTEQARDEARWLLRLDAWSRLDPAKGLSDAQRAAVRAYLDEGGGGGG